MNSSSLKILKDYIIIVLSVFVLIAGVFVLIIPSIQKNSDNNDEIARTEEVRDFNDEKIKILSNQNSLGLEKNLTSSILALPTLYNGPNLLNSLEKIAGASGVVFSGLQFAEQNKTNKQISSVDVYSYNFSLSTISDFPHIIALLRNFENTVPLFSINNVTVRASDNSSGDVSFSFQLSSYYKELPTNLLIDTVVAELNDNERNVLAEVENYSNYPLVPDTSGLGKTNPFR